MNIDLVPNQSIQTVLIKKKKKNLEGFQLLLGNKNRSTPISQNASGCLT